MTVSFREVADRCDAFDKEIEDVQEARKEFWAAVRDKLPARDVRALKAAIKARRKLRADPDGTRDHDERVDEILREISGEGERGTKIATRARAPRETDEAPAPELVDGLWVDGVTGEVMHSRPGVFHQVNEYDQYNDRHIIKRWRYESGKKVYSSPHHPVTGQLIESELRAHLDGQTGSGEAAPASGDAGEDHGHDSPLAGLDASSITSAPPIADQGPGIGSPLPLVPGPDNLDIPPFLKRGDPECVVQA
jgi:hypothetical protein